MLKLQNLNSRNVNKFSIKYSNLRVCGAAFSVRLHFLLVEISRSDSRSNSGAEFLSEA
jgi:hypothetical protein